MHELPMNNEFSLTDNDLINIKKLREETGYGIMDCKIAYINSGRNFEKAKQVLKDKYGNQIGDIVL